MRSVAVASLVLLVGCPSEAPQLRVDLRTDYVAGVEFVEAVAVFDGVPAGRTFDASERDVLDHRVAELAVRRGVFPLEVRLIGRDGSTLAARDVSVTIAGPSTGTTVVISRQCQDVFCPVGESCLGGRCVPPACIRGDEPSCPEPQCTEPTAADDCEVPAGACARAVCEFGVCAVRGAGCGTDEYCDPALGCRVVPPPRPIDAGTDSGPIDAGIDGGASDAGQPDAGQPDAGPPPDTGAMCVPGVDRMCLDCMDLAAWPAEWVEEEEALLARMNEARMEGGTCDDMPYDPLPPFVVDPTLRRLARCHSQDMAENDLFSHTGSDGRTHDDRVRDSGYPGSTSENITAGGSGGRMAAMVWLLSPGHCLAITDGRFDEVGVGLGRWEGADHGNYWTADFGRR